MEGKLLRALVNDREEFLGNPVIGGNQLPHEDLGHANRV